MGNRRRYQEEDYRRKSPKAPAQRMAGNRQGKSKNAPKRMGRAEAFGQTPRRPGRVVTLSNLLAALVGFLFILSLSVVLVLNLRTIYYFDIRYQQLEQQTGLSEETIRENYDALIDYNLITKRVKTLEFPDFPMSEHGRIHFEEVKRIFVFFQYLCIISGVILLVALFKKLPRKDYGSLKLMSVLTAVVPVVLGILAATNWNAFFVRFHELFFDNDYWIFDPNTDPIIRILPDAYFLHCAAVILLFLAVGCILTGALYRFATRRYRQVRY